MKRLITILIIAASATCQLQAQKGLHVNDIFEGKLVPQSQMVETIVRGKELIRYKLSYFHSARMKADDNIVRKIDELMRLDYTENLPDLLAEKRIEGYYMQSESKNLPGKKPVKTHMAMLPSKGNIHRFICYKRKGDELTFIYMEGTVASITELKDILNN
ncbi:MAG: hypothetical protein IJ196_03395 [Prevotella sp.]|nr:hypothetical protein [Prevotella sp.]